MGEDGPVGEREGTTGTGVLACSELCTSDVAAAPPRALRLVGQFCGFAWMTLVVARRIWMVF